MGGYPAGDNAFGNAYGNPLEFAGSAGESFVGGQYGAGAGLGGMGEGDVYGLNMGHCGIASNVVDEA